MSTFVLELNDIDLTLGHQGEVNFSSPGFVLAKGKELIVGESAKAQAYLQPRHIQNQYWMRLSTDAVAHGTPRYRHNVDLAYAQLQAIYQQADKPEEILFAVPGSFDRQQLALLLGVVKQCPFHARGLVDSAVAALSQYPLAGEVIHVDMQMHQALITVVQVGEEVERSLVEVVPAAGYLQLFDCVGQVVAEAFIQQSRFDPLHTAASEQFLFENFLTWLNQFETQSELGLEIPLSNKRYQAQVTKLNLVSRLERVYQRIADVIARMPLQSSHATVVLSARAAKCTGLGEKLGSSLSLSNNAIVRGTEAHQQVIHSDETALQYITRLPATQSTLVSSQRANVELDKPSELCLLQQNHAHRVAAAELVISRRPGAQTLLLQPGQTGGMARVFRVDNKTFIAIGSDQVAYINDRQIAGEVALRAGDKIAFDDVSQTLAVISVDT